MDEDDVDRAAILRRRALFIASALAGITTARSSLAQDQSPSEPRSDGAQVAPGAGAGNAPDCPPARAPTPEELEQAKALFQRGAALAQDGSWAEAAAILDRVHQLAPRPKTAHAAAQAWIEAQEYEKAHRILEVQRRCHGDDPSLAQLDERIAQFAGRIVVVFVGDPVTTVTLDGESRTPAELEAGVFVRPGPHRIDTTSGGSNRRAEIEVAAGERYDVTIESTYAIPMPCLSPYPCLEPPPPPRRSDSSGDFVAALGPQIAPASGGGGGGVRLAPSVRVTRDFDVALDLGAAIFAAQELRYELDGTLLARGWVAPVVYLGAGCGGGFLLGREEEDEQGFGVLVAPTVELGVAPGPLRVALRAPLWISDFRGEPWAVEDFAPQLVVGVSFADLLRDDDDDLVARR